MADTLKPIEVPAAAPAVTEPVVPEALPTAETTPAATEAPAVAETKPEETPAEAATETSAAAPTEEAKKEVKPIEDGTLEHKASPASFPKNLLYSKQHFWFGSEAVPKEKLSAYLQKEKATDVAHHVTAWASQTGKGLLFYGKDTSSPAGAIQLAETAEPTTEGVNKFSVVSKGHKHAFKAPSAADRDSWVSQLKLKIAEAKELSTSVTESETYKSTLDTFKPKPIAKKEETPVAAAATETPATEEVAPAVEAPKEEETKKEEAKEEKKERRSASGKRQSIFGSLLGKKEEKPVAAADETPAATSEPAAETAPVSEPVAAETAAVEIPTEAAPVAEDKPAEGVKETKPTPTKRSSIFGGLSFSNKKKAEPEAAPVTPAKETEPTTETAPVAETAPVIPAVETTEPLSAEVASPATVPTETVDATPATNGETKKDAKTEKRKSSLPFAFGKKDKSPVTSDEEGEKKSPFAFGKLRQTLKGKNKATPEKSAEKPTEAAAAEEKPAELPAATESTEATPAVGETAAEKPAVATSTPAVSAAA
ncbi:Pleckstrin homology domain-containing protein [Xylariales sp. AK1849]|nr:Pleckstrin homology domain-containing protein [Xylariales sp. AK1849]